MEISAKFFDLAVGP